MNKWLIVCCAVLFGACSTPPKRINKFEDASLLTIAKLQDERKSDKLIPFLKAKKPMHRQAALNAFGSIRDTSVIRFLFIALMTDQDKEVRKSAAFALGQLYSKSNAAKLKEALQLEIDEAVQGSIMEAIGKSANKDVVEFLAKFKPTSSELKKAHAKAIYRSVAVRESSGDYVDICLNYLQDSTEDYSTHLYSAYSLARLQKELTAPICNEVDELIERVTDRDLQIALSMVCKKRTEVEKKPFSLPHLASYHDNPYEYSKHLNDMEISNSVQLKALEEIAKDGRYQIIRTTAADKYFANAQEYLSAEQMLPFLLSSLRSKDMALQSLAAIGIPGNLDSNQSRQVLQTLVEVKGSLALPRQTETLFDIERAIAKLEGKSRVYQTSKPTWNHPVDWAAVRNIPENQQVILKTTKGNIKIQLHVNEAPGSVWNFLNLVDNGSYSNRFFHRVVPNFVIQGGCPRGDGWGSEDWSQRSEFNEQLSYGRGAVGLASSGNDTEGVQFFITHNPTPHLDGRYTIFGQVVEGFEIVDKIQVGDKIISIDRVSANQKE